MTVSWKRLIAFVALIAITLAGTPTQVMANDGLKSQRYGFNNKPQQQLQVAEQIEANLNQNPFRNQTVTATLSGTSIRIDRATVTEGSVARLLTEGTADRRAIAAIAEIGKQGKGDVILHASEIHPAVFSNQRGFYSGLINAGQSAMNVAGGLYDAAIDGVEMVAVAETGFASSLTAVAAGYGVMPIRPASLDIPFSLDDLIADSNDADAMKEPVATKSSVPAQLSSAVIRNIRTESISSLPATVKLKRPTASNISIEVLEFSEPVSMPGMQLLIDEYVPVKLGHGKPAAALAVPAMMINHSKKAVVDLTTKKISTRALMESAKAFVKSLLRAIEPIVGLQRALLIPQQIQSHIFQLDDLLFSSSNLKHVWNVCSLQK